MKKRTRKHDPDMPVGKLTRIPDFLPPPEELLPVKEPIKVTLTLDAETVASFKEMAEASGGKYQRMMREVLKFYSMKFG